MSAEDGLRAEQNYRIDPVRDAVLGLLEEADATWMPSQARALFGRLRDIVGETSQGHSASGAAAHAARTSSDPANPHEGDCTGTRCPDCDCCMHCPPEGGCCDGCADPDCQCPRRDDTAQPAPVAPADEVGLTKEGVERIADEYADLMGWDDESE